MILSVAVESKVKQQQILTQYKILLNPKVQSTTTNFIDDGDF